MSYLRSVIQKLFFMKESYALSHTKINTIYGCSFQFANKTQKYYSRYANSNIVGDPSKYANYEVTNNPEEWKFVERLLPKPTIPVPTPKQEYPSGWVPQTAKVRAQSYFIERNKNHMIPVYLKTNFRGQRKLTLIRKIEGNIWVLNDELTAHLKSVEKRPIGSQVDEVRGLITVKGDHVYNINQFLLSKGF